MKHEAWPSAVKGCLLYMYVYMYYTFCTYNTYVCVCVSIEKLLSSFSLPTSWVNQVSKKSCDKSIIRHKRT